MTTFLQHAVETCCKIHFRKIDPKKVIFSFGKGKKLVELQSTKHGLITIRIDKDFSENADEAELIAKIAHELAAALAFSKRSKLDREAAAEEEMNKFFGKWLRR